MAQGGLTGQRGWFDRSFCWLVNRLDLPRLTLRDHGSVFIEVFIPRLLSFLLPFFLVAKALELPLLGMCQPLGTPTGLMVLVRLFAATCLKIVGSERLPGRSNRRSSRLINHYRLPTLVLYNHLDLTNLDNSIGLDLLWSSFWLHL